MEVVEKGESEEDPIVLKLRQTSPRVTGGILRVREAALAPGLFSAKVKALTALSLSVAIRCEPCIEMYVGRALEAAATYEEVVEFLNVAMAMHGCPGEAWALKALNIFQRLSEGRPKAAERETAQACCED